MTLHETCNAEKCTTMGGVNTIRHLHMVKFHQIPQVLNHFRLKLFSIYPWWFSNTNSITEMITWKNIFFDHNWSVDFCSIKSVFQFFFFVVERKNIKFFFVTSKHKTHRQQFLLDFNCLSQSKCMSEFIFFCEIMLTAGEKYVFRI